MSMQCMCVRFYMLFQSNVGVAYSDVCVISFRYLFLFLSDIYFIFISFRCMCVCAVCCVCD